MPGAYFVTICVRGGECLLGKVVAETMRLSDMGQLAHHFWAQVPAHFSRVSIDTFAIMPNHLHVIVVIQEPTEGPGNDGEGEGTSPLQDATVQLTIQNATLGQVIAYYKYETTKQINQLREMPGVPFWQRNYWEHIVRNTTSLNRIRQYIEDNPARWAQDQLHPQAPPNRFNRWQP